jgi:hypothetical protein
MSGSGDLAIRVPGAHSALAELQKRVENMVDVAQETAKAEVYLLLISRVTYN